MVEIAVGVALGVGMAVFGFLLVTWLVLEAVYVAWLWKQKRKSRYHG